MSQPLSQNLANAIAGNYQLEIKDVLVEAWQKVHGVKAALWGAIIVGLLFGMGVGVLAGFIALFFYGFETAPQVIEIIGNVIGVLLGALFFSGELFIVFNRAAERPVRVLQLFAFRGSSLKIIFGFLLFAVVSFVIIALSLSLAGLEGYFRDNPQVNLRLVGGFLFGLLMFAYLTSMYYMFLLLVLEKKLSFWVAVKCSSMGVTQHLIKNVLIILLSFLIVLVGTIITLGIGLIWIIPMALNIIGIQYRQIFGIDSLVQQS